MCKKKWAILLICTSTVTHSATGPQQTTTLENWGRLEHAKGTIGIINSLAEERNTGQFHILTKCTNDGVVGEFQSTKGEPLSGKFTGNVRQLLHQGGRWWVYDKTNPIASTRLTLGPFSTDLKPRTYTEGYGFLPIYTLEVDITGSTPKCQSVTMVARWDSKPLGIAMNATATDSGFVGVHRLGAVDFVMGRWDNTYSRVELRYPEWIRLKTTEQEEVINIITKGGSVEYTVDIAGKGAPYLEIMDSAGNKISNSVKYRVSEHASQTLRIFAKDSANTMWGEAEGNVTINITCI